MTETVKDVNLALVEFPPTGSPGLITSITWIDSNAGVSFLQRMKACRTFLMSLDLA